MPLPKMDGATLAKPLCYDPGRDKLIYYDEIVAGREKIVPVADLTEAELKKLVIARLTAGPEFRAQSTSGPAFSPHDLIAAIERDEPEGRAMLEAEQSYLTDFLAEIQRNL